MRYRVSETVTNERLIAGSLSMLRPRQQKAIADVRAAYATGKRAPILCAPTGAGKTFTAAEIIRSTVAKGNRVWFLAHLKEILDDTCSRLERAGISYGRIMAGARSEPHRDVQVVSVQTAVRRSDLKRPNLIIVDECHLAVASTYRVVFEMCGNPLLLGLTGTPCRLDGRGLGEMFDCIVPTCSTGDLIEEGLLAPIKYYAPSRPDLTAVHMRAGDYARDELEDIVDQPMITGDAVKHYRKMCHNRPAVAFCVSVKHAEHVADSFRRAGYRAIAVSGESSKQERKDALDMLRAGSLDVVCNAQLWVAGVDVPGIECIILLRPTKSLTFYLQAIGRGLRLADGKQHCTVLDHAGCVFEHGMPDIQREWSLEGRKKKKKTDAPAVKQCPMCFGVHEPAPVCPMCGHIYTTIQRNGPQQVDGELVEFTMREAAALERKEVKEKKKEQASARTLAELEVIARDRGYKPGWARRVMAAREAKQAAASGILR
jgi:superfamily II DNA or RNA helicase